MRRVKIKLGRQHGGHDERLCTVCRYISIYMSVSILVSILVSATEEIIIKLMRKKISC